MAKDKPESGVIVKDADLKAMNAISKAMVMLTDDDREAVIQWFKRKYMNPDHSK